MRGGNKRKSRSRSNPIQSKPTKRRKKRSTSKKLIVRLSEEPTCFVREMEGIWWAELAWFFLFRGKTVNIHVQIHDSPFGCFPCFYGKMNKENYFLFLRFFWEEWALEKFWGKCSEEKKWWTFYWYSRNGMWLIGICGVAITTRLNCDAVSHCLFSFLLFFLGALSLFYFFNQKKSIMGARAVEVHL